MTRCNYCFHKGHDQESCPHNEDSQLWRDCCACDGGPVKQFRVVGKDKYIFLCLECSGIENPIPHQVVTIKTVHPSPITTIEITS